MKYFCNPLNVPYRYQFTKDPINGEIKVAREAADPSMIYFKGKYYMFASMTLSVWESEDLVNWESIRLPDNLPLYDYAPDVRVIGEYVYFSVSSNDHICKDETGSGAEDRYVAVGEREKAQREYLDCHLCLAASYMGG